MKKTQEIVEEEEQNPCLLARGKGNCMTVNTQSCRTCGFNQEENARRRRWIANGRGLELDEDGRKRLNLRGRQR